MRIQGGKILTSDGPRPADIVVEGSAIAAVEPQRGGAPAPGDIDASGRWVLPGGIDAHTHFGMPLGGGLASLGWRESSAAALLGGTTTVIDFANPDRGEPLAAAVARWRGMADGRVLCDYGLHATVADAGIERLAEVPALVAAGVPTFKGFLAYKDRLMLSPAALGQLMAAVADAGGLLLVHAEDGELNAKVEAELVAAERTAPRWHPDAHPVESEVHAAVLALDLARQAGCPLMVVHMSAAGTLAALRRAQADREEGGPAALGEVCLHHLFADDAAYRADDERALAAICSPPLRPAGHGAALLAALADGAIDMLSTDHCEFALAIKANAAAAGFPRIPNGCGGVGERLVLSYTLAVCEGRLDPWRWQQVMAERPALLMGLAGRKGRLEPGCDADIVLFDPEARYTWHVAPGSDAAGSLWDGREVTGRVTDVWLRGARAVQGGKLCKAQPGGRFLQRVLDRTRLGSPTDRRIDVDGRT
ncbi:MAG: amidohydrolase family protein [bacterium]|nr:amidohydrolase family protein [bacterium]